MLPTKEKIEQYVKKDLVRKSSSNGLNIYVYTEFTTHERLWNAVTLACRGLVYDDDGELVIRCLPKFFNDEEPESKIGFHSGIIQVIQDKLDGSLIQVGNTKKHGLVVTSKGSFNSDQANWAKEIIAEKDYTFKEGWSYIFELIHPANRIVIDYSGARKLVLLAIVENSTGNELDLYYPENKDLVSNFECVECVNADWAVKAGRLVEGVVIKSGSHRIKVKNPEYVRLHRIVTNYTEKRVWEALRDGESLDFEDMPEEFEEWLTKTKQSLALKYMAIYRKVHNLHKETQDMTDKELGLSDTEYKNLIFNLRKDKSIEHAVWNLIKPKEETNGATENINA